MPTFKYIGGETESGDVQEIINPQTQQRHIRDDRQKEEMPAKVDVFNHSFILEREVKIDRKKFRDLKAYDHAIAKLRSNQFFEEVAGDDEDEITDAVIVDEVAAKPKRSKSKAVAAKVADGDTE